MKNKGKSGLERGHFAFMRALLQGLDERESWQRYLGTPGETADLRTVRHTIAWIRDEFSAAARREQRPGTARLVRLDPQRFSAPVALPTLAEFAALRGLEEFSEGEQAEAYALEYGDGHGYRDGDGDGHGDEEGAELAGASMRVPVAAPAGGATTRGTRAGGEAGRAAPVIRAAAPSERQSDRRPAAPGLRLARPSQRARVIARQLEALRWLEQHLVRDPRAEDDVAAWLNPAVAERLHGAGLTTLAQLVERINGEGERWWRRVPGVGATKATRVVNWLRNHQAATGSPGLLLVGPTSAAAPGLSSPSGFGSAPGLAPGFAPGFATGEMTAAAQAPTSLERLRLPSGLDGSRGAFRAPQAQCLLTARSDLEAIALWLMLKKGSGAFVGERLPSSVPGVATPNQLSARHVTATQRAYRKEAERLMLWAVLVCEKPMSSLTAEDAAAYAAFLASPPAAWCAPRHHARGSSAWRPFEGPLSAAAQRHALTVVRSLFAFLVNKAYLMGNPFAALAQPAPAPRPLGSGRALSCSEWEALEAMLDRETAHADTDREAGQKRANNNAATAATAATATRAKETRAAKVATGMAAQARAKTTASEAQRRLLRAVRWLYATGLRRSELTAARCGDLERLNLEGRQQAAGSAGLPQADAENSIRQASATQPTFEKDAGVGTAAPVGWLLKVMGRVQRWRQVPVPAELIAELQEELQRQGRTGDVCASTNREVPILARFGDAAPGSVPLAISSPSLAPTPAPTRVSHHVFLPDRATAAPNGTSSMVAVGRTGSPVSSIRCAPASAPRAWSASALHKALKAAFARLAAERGDDLRLSKASAHWLRHSHGSHALNGRSGHPRVSLAVVRNNLGHASLDTTSRYLGTRSRIRRDP